MKNPLSVHWALEPEIVFLNHGSFGACPKVVLHAQAELRLRMEAEPVRFFVRELPALIEETRAEVAAFVGARPADLAFVSNATEGVNAVLRAYEPKLSPGDELLTTDHAYNACKNALLHLARRTGARLVIAPVPFPIEGPEAVLEALEAHLSERTALLLVDHISSATGLIFPIAEIVAMAEGRGVPVLVDGAHAPGMVPLDLRALGASYYAANFHKWTCAPKGAAMLVVREDRQAGLHPLAISHGYGFEGGRSAFLEEFDWTGTRDPSPWLSVPAALRHVGGLHKEGWEGVRAHNRELCLRGRSLLCESLGLPEPAPASMIGSIASVPLPPGEPGPPLSPLYADPLQLELYAVAKIEVPVPPWPAPPARLIRISAHLYNEEREYRLLAETLPLLL